MNRLFARDLWALALILTLLFLQPPAMSSELVVPVGCAAPADATGGRIFYIDPVHGSMANDGSAERPWRTFADVVAQPNRLISTRAYKDYPKGGRDLQSVNPDGPVKPGDTLVLMSGEHGDVDLRLYTNDRFIHVVAGKNQTPVIRSMRIFSSSHWLFKGIKFQDERSEKNHYDGLVQIGEHDYFGPADNIVFDSNSFSSRDDVVAWSDVDWVNKPYDYAFKSFSPCTTLFSNHFYNVRNAAAISGNDSLVMDNLIEHFGNDGLDITASNLKIIHNVIKSGHHTPAESLHADGIQGWSLRGAPISNVLIEANMVIDINQSDENYMQGISIFDGVWDGIKVINNVVVTNTWHGIALYGVDNAEIINNTVVPARPGKYNTWINIHAAKNKKPSSNVVVRNNIAGEITAGGVNVVVDHNISSSGVASVKTNNADPFSDSVELSDNLTNVPLNSLFRQFDMPGQTFDLHLAPSSLAQKAGSDKGAPAVDIEGRPRKPQIDIGAYAR